MVAPFRIEDFESALAAGLTNLTEDQILAIKEFVKQVVIRASGRSSRLTPAKLLACDQTWAIGVLSELSISKW
jgi:hypothetical protein